MSDTTVPAGWYADPAGDRGQRWWDGFRWTGHVQPAPFEMSLATRPSEARNRAPENSLAFYALILGVVGLAASALLLPSVAAVACGAAALRRSGGRGMAAAGVASGLIGLAAFLI